MIETEDRSVYAPSDTFRAAAHVKDMEDYRRRYAESLRDPEAFWAKEARRLEWVKPWDKVLDWNFSEPRIEWFRGGRLNVSANCLDRHLAAGLGSRTALIWEGNEPGESRHVSYAELHAEVCRFANALKSLGVQKGDRVAVYMPMVPELPVVLLACARIGAVHSVIFGGFSAESIRNRILDSSCSIVVTADEGLRGTKTIPLKAVVDEALVGVDCVRHVVVFARTGKAVPMVSGRDIAWAEAVRGKDSVCPPEPMESEDPLFILYTSGSTGKPKGVLHTTAGYLLHAAITHELIFDYHAGEVYWCTADIGWVTGHSYVVYGPLANGATTLLFEGIPTHPGIDRFWQVIEKHEVNIFYTAPTAIRALMREGPEPAQAHPMESLRLLGTVGEPINPEAWRWYHRHVGKGRCPIVDTWWQTETGGILISPLPGAFPLKPGSATLPFFGVHPVVVDERGQPFPDGVPARGNLCISHPWPGIMRTVYGDHARFRDTYFSLYPGLYFTGDGCIRDEDGYYWITGRVDDVLNVSGHRIGTAEVESALVSHPSVAEAAVVGMPHDLKGQGIFAFVTVKTGIAATEELRKALGLHVRKVIGAHAAPDTLQFASGLPKTRSGKIMRRILRKIAGGESHDFGDTSTLADSSVLESLVPKRKAEED